MYWILMILSRKKCKNIKLLTILVSTLINWKIIWNRNQCYRDRLAPEINKKLIDKLRFDSKIREETINRMVSKLISNEDIYKEDKVKALARFGLKEYHSNPSSSFF